MTKEIGTLEEIGAQVGDVVGYGMFVYTVGPKKSGRFTDARDGVRFTELPHFRIITKAAK